MLRVGNISKDAKVRLAILKDGSAGNAKLFTKPVELKWTALGIMQRSESTLKFIIPSTMEMGIYAFRIVDRQIFSDPVHLNATVCWWFQGDQGKTVSPGLWLLLSGNCLKSENRKTTTQLF